MVAIEKVLKRKDAASVVVAIVLALIVSQLLALVTADLSARIAGLGDSTAEFAPIGDGWRLQYLHPFVNLVVQVVVLEVLIRLYVGARSMFGKK